MSVTDCPPRPAPASAGEVAELMICVVGTAEVLRRFEGDIDLLRRDEVELMTWRLDADAGEPPPAADWADGLVVLNSDAWAAPGGCARLQALLKMAWRCGRTLALCGDAVNSLGVLGLPRDAAVNADGLFICPQEPCRETLARFIDAVHRQPHRRR